MPPVVIRRECKPQPIEEVSIKAADGVYRLAFRPITSGGFIVRMYRKGDYVGGISVVNHPEETIEALRELFDQVTR